MVDSHGRVIEYMRISITDRCNLRCKYCMPDGIEAVPMSDILTFEEIESCVRVAAKEGIKFIKITGGEPLVRRGVASLVKMIKQVDGIESVTLTTNGVLLQEHLDVLIAAGVDGINVSLDTLDRNRYQEITGFDVLPQVLEGIEAAYKSGVSTKINVVALRSEEVDGLSEDYWKLIERTLDYSVDVRFIEMMPIGLGKLFSVESTERILEEIKKRYPRLCRDVSTHGYGPAVYYRIPGAKGSIGFISAIHGKFCDSCNRIRLSSKGYLKTCLCYEDGADLREILRSNQPQQVMEKRLQKAIRETILLKPKEHCFDKANLITEEKYMSSIGG